MRKISDLPPCAIVFDCEDAIAIHQKDVARAGIPASLAAAHAAQRHALVRINALTSIWWEADARAAVAAGAGTLLVPKAEDPAAFVRLDAVLAEAERASGVAPGSVRAIALIETALGVGAMREVLQAPRIECATLGLADLAVDLGTSWDDALLGTPSLFLNERTQLSLVSRALRREPPIDTVWLAIAEDTGFAGDVALGRRLGCQGKFVIHPSQIETVNAAYAVTDEERTRAQSIVDAYDAAARDGKGALMLDGMLVDEPVVLQARRMLERAAR